MQGLTTRKPTFKRALYSNTTGSLRIRSDPGPSISTPLWDIPERTPTASDVAWDNEDDDMTLAQRRDLIIHRQSSLSRQSRETPVVQRQLGSAPLSSKKLERRDSNYNFLKNESKFAKWRESMQHTQAPESYQRAVDEAMMTAMLEDRREAELEKQQKEREKVAQEQLMDARMKTQIMLESHRRAMSQMQGRIASC